MSICFTHPTAKMKHGRVVNGLDLDALSSALAGMDAREMTRRKRQFNRLYHEALLRSDPGKGISFTDMLLILAQYKLVQPENALK